MLCYLEFVPWAYIILSVQELIDFELLYTLWMNAKLVTIWILAHSWLNPFEQDQNVLYEFFLYWFIDICWIFWYSCSIISYEDYLCSLCKCRSRNQDWAGVEKWRNFSGRFRKIKMVHSRWWELTSMILTSRTLTWPVPFPFFACRFTIQRNAQI